MSDDYDNPWKETLDVFFSEIVELAAPDLHAAVDWSRGWESLEQELSRIVGDGGASVAHVDKLMRVWLTSGEEEWLLTHIEVQSQAQAEFPGRMIDYASRIRSAYDRWPVSLAILADDRPDWRPDRFFWSQYGSSLEFRFRTMKLLDYADSGGGGPASPLRLLIQAHLETLGTKNRADERRQRKIGLVRRLFAYGWSREQIERTFRLLDWFIQLPPEADRQFFEDCQRLREEIHVPYITSLERHQFAAGKELGLSEGRLRALRQSVEKLARRRFGAIDLLDRLDAFDETTLEQLEDALTSHFEATTFEAWRAATGWTPPPAQ